jgi:hypothetical protein
MMNQIELSNDMQGNYLWYLIHLLKGFCQGENYLGKALREQLHVLHVFWKEHAISQFAKIYITFFQILSSFISYPVPWPQQLIDIMVWCKAIFQVDVTSLPTVSCLWSGINFPIKLFIYTIVPLVIIIFLYLPVAIYRLFTPKSSDDIGTAQGFRQTNQNLSDDAEIKERRQARLERLETKFYKNLMFWLFLIYPQASLISLQAFNCEPVGLGRLAADYSLECPGRSLTDLSHWLRQYSVVFAFLFIFGIPAYMYITMLRMGVNKIAQRKLENSLVHSMISTFSGKALSEEEKSLLKKIGVVNSFNQEALDESIEIAYQHQLKDLIEYYQRIQQIQDGGPLKLYTNFPNADSYTKILESHDKDRDGDFTEMELKSLTRSLLLRTGGCVGWEDLNTFRYEHDQLMLMVLIANEPRLQNIQGGRTPDQDSDGADIMLGETTVVDFSKYESLGLLRQLLQGLHSGAALVLDDKTCPDEEMQCTQFSWPEKKNTVFHSETNLHFVEVECKTMLMKRKVLIHQMEHLLSLKTSSEQRDNANSSQGVSRIKRNFSCFFSQTKAEDQNENNLEYSKLALKDAVHWWISLNCDWLWFVLSSLSFMFWLKRPSPKSSSANWNCCKPKFGFNSRMHFAASAYSVCRRLRDEGKRFVERERELFGEFPKADQKFIDKEIMKIGFSAVLGFEILKQLLIEHGRDLLSQGEFTVAEPEWSTQASALRTNNSCCTSKIQVTT